MADYAVTFARSARKELEALDPPLAARVLARIEALAIDPWPAGARKLRGAQRLWRIRIGDYRIVYSVDGGQHVVDIVRVRHRRDVYR
jgi:mRNA interferase RelE/StbE